MLNRNLIFYCLSLSLILLLTQCAQVGTLTGGPKDTLPPQLDIASSTKNPFLNYRKQKIELVFNEYINLNNAAKEVVVSPLLAYRPKVRMADEKVIFEFDEREVLRENTTYTINFGQSIKDYTEGNTAKNITYALSTGKDLDSLSIGGQVKSATDQKAIEDAVVMLYDNLADSVLRTERPFYYGKTDKSGRFSIKNMKAGRYKVVGLVEKNGNYQLDNPNEMVGFLERPIDVEAGKTVDIDLAIFEQKTPTIITKMDSSQYGLLKIFFSGHSGDITISGIPSNIQTWQSIESDTIQLWHHTPAGEEWKGVAIIGERKDSFKVNAKGVEAFMKEGKLSLANESDKKIIPFNPFKPLEMVFNMPIENLNTSKVNTVLIVDSVRTNINPSISINAEEKTNLVIDYNWQQDTIYELMFLPNSISSLLGNELTDTIIKKYRPLPAADFGSLIFKFEGIAKDTAYLVELMFKRDNLVESFIVKNDTVVNKEIIGLPAGEYQLNITEDVNDNGHWDTGSYDERRQAERQKIKTLEPVRGSWGVETVINLSDIFNPKAIMPIDTIEQKN